MSDCKFGQDEDKMIYFFLLSSLRKEHFEAVGIEEKKPYSYLTDEEKINIIANLTSKQKAIIRRDFLIANFKNAYGNNSIASLLLDFAQKHMPDLLADIKNGHNEVNQALLKVIVQMLNSVKRMPKFVRYSLISVIKKVTLYLSAKHTRYIIF